MPIIAVHQLEKRFSSRIVLQDLNLKVDQGEYVVISGPNGAGKSTLLRLLAGLEKPDLGSIEMPSIIGYLSHASSLYEELTPRENLQFFADIYRLKNRQQRVTELLEQIHLTSRQNDPVHFLSRGMIRRLAISRAIIMEPEILLLDEPFSGIDFESQKALLPVLHQIQQNGCTVLITTHEYSFLDMVDFRLVILNDQHLVYNELCHSSEEAEAVYKNVLAYPNAVRLESEETHEMIAISSVHETDTHSKSNTGTGEMGIFGLYWSNHCHFQERSGCRNPLPGNA